MIDMNKQYTYKGRPVRIYADGSDTAGGALHCAALSDDSDTKGKWYLIALYESDLVAVWEPKEGEWCLGCARYWGDNYELKAQYE